MPILGKIGPPEAALRLLKLSASTVLEVENSRSEFWLEIKILLYKSTSGNTKMASELELVTKQKFFISKIPWFFSASRNQMISIIKIFVWLDIQILMSFSCSQWSICIIEFWFRLDMTTSKMTQKHVRGRVLKCKIT